MQFLAIYAAQDLGLWKEQGLDVQTVLITGIGAFNAVISGSADFSVSSAASLTRAAAHGQRMLAIANLIDKPVWTLVVRKEVAEAAHFDPNAPLATRAEILAGKKIAVDGINSIVHGYLRVIAKIGGVDPDSLVVAPMAPSETLAAFRAAPSMVWSTARPGRSRCYKTAAPLRWRVRPPAIPVGSHQRFRRHRHAAAILRRSSLDLHEMGRGIAEGVKFIHDKPYDGLALLKKHFDKINPAVVERAFKAVVIGSPMLPSVTAKVMANSERLNIEAGLEAPSDQLKSYDGLFTDEFVK